MKISYEGFRKMMRKKGIRNTDLRQMGFSPSVIHRLMRDENVTVYTLMQFCEIFDCDLTDLVTLKKEAA